MSQFDELISNLESIQTNTATGVAHTLLQIAANSTSGQDYVEKSQSLIQQIQRTLVIIPEAKDCSPNHDGDLNNLEVTHHMRWLANADNPLVIEEAAAAHGIRGEREIAYMVTPVEKPPELSKDITSLLKIDHFLSGELSPETKSQIKEMLIWIEKEKNRRAELASAERAS